VTMAPTLALINLTTLIQLLSLRSASTYTALSSLTTKPHQIISTRLHSSTSVIKEIDRRDAVLSSFATILTVVGTAVLPEPTAAREGLPLLTVVEQLESANYIGQVGKPIYPPNVGEDPERHMPRVKVKGNDVEISVNHVQKEDDYVQFMWLKDVGTNEVVLAKELTGVAEEKPVLSARVPSGVELRPYVFDKKDGLWKGEPFKVS